MFTVSQSRSSRPTISFLVPLFIPKRAHSRRSSVFFHRVYSGTSWGLWLFTGAWLSIFIPISVSAGCVWPSGSSDSVLDFDVLLGVFSGVFSGDFAGVFSGVFSEVFVGGKYIHHRGSSEVPRPSDNTLPSALPPCRWHTWTSGTSMGRAQGYRRSGTNFGSLNQIHAKKNGFQTFFLDSVSVQNSFSSCTVIFSNLRTPSQLRYAKKVCQLRIDPTRVTLIQLIGTRKLNILKRILRFSFLLCDLVF